MLIRWLLTALLISVVVLLLVAVAVTWHVRRQRREQADETRGSELQNPEPSEPEKDSLGPNDPGGKS